MSKDDHLFPFRLELLDQPELNKKVADYFRVIDWTFRDMHHHHDARIPEGMVWWCVSNKNIAAALHREFGGRLFEEQDGKAQ